MSHENTETRDMARICALLRIVVNGMLTSTREQYLQCIRTLVLENYHTDAVSHVLNSRIKRDAPCRLLVNYVGESISVMNHVSDYIEIPSPIVGANKLCLSASSEHTWLLRIEHIPDVYTRFPLLLVYKHATEAHIWIRDVLSSWLRSATLQQVLNVLPIRRLLDLDFSGFSYYGRDELVRQIKRAEGKRISIPRRSIPNPISAQMLRQRLLPLYDKINLESYNYLQTYVSESEALVDLYYSSGSLLIPSTQSPLYTQHSALSVSSVLYYSQTYRVISNVCDCIPRCDTTLYSRLPLKEDFSWSLEDENILGHERIPEYLRALDAQYVADVRNIINDFVAASQHPSTLTSDDSFASICTDGGLVIHPSLSSLITRKLLIG